MKKGFTLVELLAVIVILAIILAIAVPTIGNLIANSKKSMFANSAKLILKSMKNDYDEKIASTGIFTDTFILYDNGIRTVYPSSNDLVFAISVTDGGIVRHSDGTVTFALYDGINCSVKSRLSNDITVTTTDKTTCLNNIMYRQTTAPFTNMVTNTTLLNNTSWSNDGGTISASNGILTSTVTNVSSSGGNAYNYSGAKTVGYKYYIKVDVRVLSEQCTNITYGFPGQFGFNNPNANYWYTVSGVATMSSTYGYTVIYHHYPSSSIANGKQMQIKEPITIDLTTIYGSGNEPTKEQMDHNLNKVWIDTTMNTPKRFIASGWIAY